MVFCCSSKTSSLVESNKEANAVLQKSRKDEKQKIKLLLLGAGESGKSTIFKQMKILYNYKAITDEERRKFTDAVYQYVITGTKGLLKHVTDATGKPIDTIKDKEAFELVQMLPESSRVDPTIGKAIASLWADPEVQDVFSRRSELQITESIKYFMDSMDRVMDVNYLATANDHLYVRVRTTGVTTSNYDINGVRFEMYDVGGQRNERRKWIHCFEGVNAVIFVAALSEYDQALFEDHHTNRMSEALDLFEEVCSLKYFLDTSIILFLNKYDLFQDKLKERPIAECVVKEKIEGELVDTRPWADYHGPNDPISARNYFKDKFLERNHLKKRLIYFHVTTATDTGNMKFVFEACKDIILEQNIDESGF